jgi:hypothetical protein
MIMPAIMNPFVIYLRQTVHHTAAVDNLLHRMRHHVTEEAAYFHWINRGRPLFGNPLEDWAAAEEEVNSSWPVLYQFNDFIAESLHQLVIAEGAYLHWINRGAPLFGNPFEDWAASEAEAVDDD